MKKLQLDEAQGIALKALKEYPRVEAKVIELFMKGDDWTAGGKGNMYMFTLFDMSRAEEAEVQGKIRPTGWKKEPEPLLTIYVNRESGDTFIHRHVPKYPWEEAA